MRDRAAAVFLNQTLPERLEERGVSRRAFLNFCGVMATTLALPASYRTTIADAPKTVRRPVLIWRQFQDCAGNSESILRSPHPDVAQIVLETLGLDWSHRKPLVPSAHPWADLTMPSKAYVTPDVNPPTAASSRELLLKSGTLTRDAPRAYDGAARTDRA